MRRLLILMTLTPFLTACANSLPEQTALCTATKADRSTHTRNLIEDGGPKSRASGLVLLGKFQRGCAE